MKSMSCIRLNFVYMQSTDSTKELLFIKLNKSEVASNSRGQDWGAKLQKQNRKYETGNNWQKWRSQQKL